MIGNVRFPLDSGGGLMKIGIGAFLTDQSIDPAALAPAVEERGFECLLVPEHSHIPTSRPHVPIYLGGWRAAAIRRTRELGDGRMTGNAPDAEGVRAQRRHPEDAPEKPVSVFGVGDPELDVLDAYREAGAERVALLLESAPEAESLALLDRWAPLADRLA